ncbi:MAG: ribonuclease III [Candidatus Auribacterota bacterium]|jgi:ribonuclease-3|nr:ribonuclease III [Candidatus Auribacterota bacterium]
MERGINEFIESISYRFTNRELLVQALTHRSYASEQANHCPDNERLEFLGDAIIGSCVAEELFRIFPEYSEGQLSLIKSYLVSAKMLSQLAEQINLGNVLYLGIGEEKTGGRMRQTLLCNTFEAIVGAVFLDGGYQAAHSFLWPLIRPNLDTLDACVTEHNVKNALQNYCHKHFSGLPKYHTKSIAGPPHQRIYTIEVHIDDTMLGTGSASSKKKASIDAAHNALKNLQVLP